MPNQFFGKGNLADAPTLKVVKIGGEDRHVAEMRVMFDEYRYNEEKQEYEQKGGFWMQVSQWDEGGQNAARLLRKGARVKVEGSLRQFMYTPDGAKEPVPGFQVVADEIALCLGSRIESISFAPKRERETEPA